MCGLYYTEKKKNLNIFVEIYNTSIFIWHAKVLFIRSLNGLLQNISDYEFSLIKLKTWTELNFNLYENSVPKFRDRPDIVCHIYSQFSKKR